MIGGGIGAIGIGAAAIQRAHVNLHCASIAAIRCADLAAKIALPVGRGAIQGPIRDARDSRVASAARAQARVRAGGQFGANSVGTATTISVTEI